MIEPIQTSSVAVSEALAGPLHVDAIKQRQGYSYIEAHHAIREANTIFGHLSWSRETLSNDLVCTCPYKGGDMVAVSYVARVAITVTTDAGSVVRHGTGYGDGQAKAERAYTAHELAAKEAESDAMKRALSTFGDRFGLALYEKDKSKANVTTERRQQPAQRGPAEQQVAPTSKANSRSTYEAMVKAMRKTTNQPALDRWIALDKVQAARSVLPGSWKKNLADDIAEHRKDLIAHAEMDRLARVDA